MEDSDHNAKPKLDSLLDDPVFKISSQLAKLQDSPRLLVLISHGFLELLINTLIEAKCKNGKKITSSQRDYPHSAKLLILNEMNVISDWMYRMLDRFRKLRNKAAHEPLFELTKNDLCNWGLKPELHDPKNFYWICETLSSLLWNEHLEIFRPVFAPSLERVVQVIKSERT